MIISTLLIFLGMALFNPKASNFVPDVRFQIAKLCPLASSIERQRAKAFKAFR
jgi:hypothetical protein